MLSDAGIPILELAAVSLLCFRGLGEIERTDWGSRTLSRTCSMDLQAMKSVNVTAALPPPLGVMVKGSKFTCA